MRTYLTEERAFKRVRVLINTKGCWPAVRKVGNRWVLTYDPMDEYE
jgi:hypothetical protein